MQACGNLFASFGHRSGQNENRIGAAHLRKERNGLGTRGSQVHQCASGRARTCKSASFDRRMLYQSAAHLSACIKQQSESSIGSACFVRGFSNRAANHLTGAGVCRMRLDHNRISGG